MTLADASFEALLRLADTYGADVPENVTRDELEALVQEAMEEWRAEHERSNSDSFRIEETKYQGQPEHEREPPPEDDVELPESYNETRVVLMLRDPSWAFAYWDIKDSVTDDLQNAEEFGGLLLRVYSLPGAGGELEGAVGRFDIPVSILDNRWYINLPEQDLCYRIVLVATVDGVERELSRSNMISAPRGSLPDLPEGSRAVEDEILAQTGIQDLDVPGGGQRIPQRILDLIDEDLLFN